ncbi:MAG: F0F1 ATP synthase subunit A [Alphaproteobacteria bacterium]
MSHSPLSQFEIKTLFPIEINGIDLSFTNSSLYMMISLIITACLFILPMRNANLIPSRFQNIPEIMYKFISGTINDTVGSEGKKYFPLIFSLFIFVLMSNLVGMLPYSFTVTSHIIVTFALAIFIFVTVTIIALIRHGFHFFSFFLPSGTPLWLAPLMVVIELFTYLARPVSLSIRLAANMVAGHILLKVLAGFVILMGVFWGWVPMAFIVIFTGFEIFVAILQAYIFTILTCVYLNDAIHLH